jgi:5-formyltetrahydrofolate cyclo-ligase
MPANEIQTHSLVQAIFAHKKRCFVPRIETTLHAPASSALSVSSADGMKQQPPTPAPVATSTMRMIECYNEAEIKSFQHNRWHIPEPPLTVSVAVSNTTNSSASSSASAASASNTAFAADSTGDAKALWRADALECDEVDLVVVPGVAFAAAPGAGAGRALRLGHGRGYYDRWLSALHSRRSARQPPLPMPLIVGIGLSPQFLSDPSLLPTAAHDFVLDAVIRPK